MLPAFSTTSLLPTPYWETGTLEFLLLFFTLFYLSYMDAKSLKIRNKALAWLLAVPLFLHLEYSRLPENFYYIVIGPFFTYLLLVLLESSYTHKTGAGFGMGGGDRKFLAFMSFWVGWIPVFIGLPAAIYLALFTARLLPGNKGGGGEGAGDSEGIPFAPLLSFSVFLAYAGIVIWWRL